jgi:NADPH:quinone reductase-like Zn-dependent oxidoreductase
MLAAVVRTLGQAPHYEDFSDPIVGSNEVLIQVRAAGLHPIVRALAAGSHYSAKAEVPMVAGLDAVGTKPDGERVYFGSPRRPWGTMAERCAAPAAMCFPLPDRLDDAQAAAIANPGMSAWLSLAERAELQKGETVLVMGATGVAGQLALQLARTFGAHRIIAAGRNVDLLAKADVDAIVPLGEPEDTIREALCAQAALGIDVIIDYLWGRPTERLVQALTSEFKPSSNRTTRLVEVGETAGRTISLPGSALRSLDLRFLGSGFGSARMDRIFAAIPKLFEAAAAGTLRVDVDAVPLADVEVAWERLQGGKRTVFTI